MSLKIALLIDAENMSYRELPYILKEVGRQGQIILQAAYGDWKQPHLQTWREAAKDYDFHIRHQTSDPFTKNSTDMKLIMDAMEVLYRTPADCFCLVTNDADYVPLCDKLHEARKYVIGVGYQRASGALIRSCDQFLFIRNGKTPVQPYAKSFVAVPSYVPTSVRIEPTPLNPAQKMELQNLILEAFAKALQQDVDRWTALSALGIALREVEADFEPDTYGYSSLSKLLKHMPNFVELHLKGKVVKLARLKNRASSEPLDMNELEKLVSEAFAKEQEIDGWVSLSALGTALREVEEDFKPITYGRSSLSKLLKSLPDLVELGIKGNTVKSARLKN